MNPTIRSPAAALALLAVMFAAGSPATEAASTEKRFRVTLLGTGSPAPLPWRMSQSIAIEAGEQTILIDAGRGALLRLATAFRDPAGKGFAAFAPTAGIDTLFLTHLHSDHVVGIPDLVVSGALIGRRGPLRVLGPAGTAEMVGHFVAGLRLDYGWRTDDGRKSIGKSMTAVGRDAVVDGFVWENEGLRVSAFAVDHQEVKPAFGYRVEFDGRVATFSGDTRYSEAVKRHGAGAHLLVHSVGMAAPPLMKTPRMQYIQGHHTQPDDAGRVFAAARPKLAVYSHFALFGVSLEQVKKATRTTYDGPLVFGCDLMTFELLRDTVKVNNRKTDRSCLAKAPK